MFLVDLKVAKPINLRITLISGSESRSISSDFCCVVDFAARALDEVRGLEEGAIGALGGGLLEEGPRGGERGLEDVESRGGERVSFEVDGPRRGERVRWGCCFSWIGERERLRGRDERDSGGEPGGRGKVSD